MAWRQVRWFPTIVLMFAAFSKAFHAPALMASEGWLASPALLFALVFGEAACAVGILLARPRLSWLWTLAMFTGFSMFAGYAWMTGQSCDCFGTGSNAEVSLLLDLGILATCLVFQPRGSNETRWTWKTIAACSVLAGVVVVSGAGYRLLTVDRANPIKFLLPETLLGTAWPLDHHFAPELDELEVGHWLILVVREDCPHCLELLAEYFADPQRHRQHERTVLFVAGREAWTFVLDRVALDAPPQGTIRWAEEEPFVASPAVFEIQEGTVVAAADGSEADVFLDDVFSTE